jgi:hypothetical protein
MNAVREAARQIDPNLPLTDVSTLIEQVENGFSRRNCSRRPHDAVVRARRLPPGPSGLAGGPMVALHYE